METGRDNTDADHLVKVSWLFGLLYGVVVGWSIPKNLQATVILTTVVMFVWRELERRSQNSRSLRVLLGLGLLNALSFSIISNYRLQALNWLVAIATLFYCAYPLLSGDLPRSALTFVLSSVREATNCLLRSLRAKPLTELFAFRMRLYSTKLDVPVLAGIVFSAAVAIVTCALLGNVNEEFDRFLYLIWRQVFQIIDWLLKLGIFEIFFTALVVALVTYVFLSESPDRESGFRTSETIFHFPHYFVVLLPTTLILIIFSIFQLKWLGVSPGSLDYKSLSDYVHKGFWELLLVAGMCACLWYPAEQQSDGSGTQADRGRGLLFVLAALLALLAAFSLHKLLVQQVAFGLRDQRVLATLASSLLLLSFIGFLLILTKKITHSQLFLSQLFGLLISSLLVSYLNIDLLITRVYPLRFPVSPTSSELRLDFSYLLTNSYDNSSSWIQLMSQVEESDLIYPANYYWGPYRFICDGNQWPESTFREHLNRLISKYEDQGRDLRRLMQFNLREYQAYKLAKEHASEFEEFNSFVDEKCRA